MKTKIQLTAVFLFLFILAATGQKGVILKETSQDGTPSFIRIDKDSLKLQMDQSQNVLKEFLKFSSNDEMRMVSTKADNLGFTHQYFQQFYKGIRVEYGIYAVHAKNDLIETLNGTFKRIKTTFEIQPSLNESQALDFALREIDAKLYKWQIPEEESWINENFGLSYYPKGELVIIQDENITGNCSLAWKFDVYAHNPLSRNYIFVDAVSGLIIKKTSIIHNTNANGSGDTRYSGTRNIVTDSYSGGFRLKEIRNQVRIETYNMFRDTVYSLAALFVDNNNSWTIIQSKLYYAIRVTKLIYFNCQIESNFLVAFI